MRTTGMDAGLFGPDSVTWRVNRERAMLLGGGCALLLQLAHPLVAAGVSQHSDFRDDPLKRLNRTLDATLAIVFGTTDQAERSAQQIQAVHATVRGTLTESTGAFPEATPYRAQDPALLLWVHATLVDTSIRTYQLLFGRLRGPDVDRYYGEASTVARKLGVPEEILPPDYASFRRYYEGMISGPEIAVGPTARELGRTVLYPRLRFIPRPVFSATAVMTVGLLPLRVRERYGFEWNGIRERAFHAEAAVAGRVARVLPAPLRLFPQAREAERRVAAVA